MNISHRSFFQNAPKKKNLFPFLAPFTFFISKTCPVGTTLALFSLIFSISTGTAPAETITERSQARLSAAPPICVDTVDFVVCADPQPPETLITPPIFLQMIQEWNISKPDLVMCVGDMIMGGPPDAVGPQWDTFEKALSGLQIPFFPTAGNHDVSDDPGVIRVYERRVGPFTYTIARGNVLFVVLNTEEPGDPDGLTADQRAWLRAVLEKSTARHIFLFLHVPLFDQNWDRDWQATADIIKGYPVRAVFAGHMHYYRDCGVRDGVRYVVAGSAGGEVRTPEDEGGFFCYLAVRVRGDDISWSVIRPGAVLPENVITPASIERVRTIKRSLTSEKVRLPWDETLNHDVQITLKNPFSSPLHLESEWSSAVGWRVQPEKLTFDVPPNGSLMLASHAETTGSAGFPTPILQGEIKNPESGKAIALECAVDLTPTVHIPHAEGPITLDGDLSEWTAATPLPLRYGVAYDPQDKNDLDSQTRLMWDESHLYVAVEVDENEFYQPYNGDVVWMADSVELWIDNSNWSFSLSIDGPQVFLDERPDKHLDAVIDTVPLAVKRNGRKTIYEAAYPAAELPQVRLTAENVVRFSLLVNDLDTSGPITSRHYAELTPGAGDHFACPMVELTLDPAKK